MITVYMLQMFRELLWRRSALLNTASTLQKCFHSTLPNYMHVLHSRSRLSCVYCRKVAENSLIYHFILKLIAQIIMFHYAHMIKDMLLMINLFIFTKLYRPIIEETMDKIRRDEGPLFKKSDSSCLFSSS